MKLTGDLTACRHTPQPAKWAAYLEWRKEIIKEHVQTQCPHCGKWAVWKKKDERNTPKNV